MIATAYNLDQIGGPALNFGGDPKETRYTESLTEWLAWQKDKVMEL